MYIPRHRLLLKIFKTGEISSIYQTLPRMELHPHSTSLRIL